MYRQKKYLNRDLRMDSETLDNKVKLTKKRSLHLSKRTFWGGFNAVIWFRSIRAKISVQINDIAPI